MNEQIESQTILFAEMMKNHKRRIVAYSYVLARVLLRFYGFRSSTQKKLYRFSFLRTLSRTVCKKICVYLYSVRNCRG